MSGVCEYFTYTRVPPRKSTPHGMPCQNSMESTPATLKISEKARKYHFFPRKSMLVLRKNSTGLSSPLSVYDLAPIWRVIFSFSNRPISRFISASAPLDAKRFPALLAGQHPIKNYTRHEDCGKQVRQQTKGERGGESFHRSATENE